MQRDEQIFWPYSRRTRRQIHGLELNCLKLCKWQRVMEATSVLTNKYAEGYPGRDIMEGLK
jgi:glycine/serine hydroxymethyltransferase